MGKPPCLRSFVNNIITEWNKNANNYYNFYFNKSKDDYSWKKQMCILRNYPKRIMMHYRKHCVMNVRIIGWSGGGRTAIMLDNM